MKKIDLSELSFHDSTILEASPDRLHIVFGKEGGKIGIMQPEDLQYRYLIVDSTLEADHSVPIELNFYNEGAKDFKLGYRFGTLPNFKTRLCIDLALIDSRTIFTPRTPGTLKMVVHGNRMEKEEVARIEFGIRQCVHDMPMLLENAYLSDEMPAEFPIPDVTYCDEFGQWTGKDWPGKIKSEEELRNILLSLYKDAQPLPTRSKWGGELCSKLTNGAGFFKTLKTADGKWHVVDPDGYDFYSLGCDCVRVGENARLDQYPDIAQLPPPPFDVQPDQEEGYFNYTEANLRRVFGDEWKAAFRCIAENTLIGAGVNTIANWSDDMFRQGDVRIPYVWQPRVFPTTAHTIFRDFPDVLSEEYAQDAVVKAQALLPHRDDPWQIGYFLRNEPEFAFVPGILIADEVIRDAADTACKRGILQALTEQYGDIAALNAVWGTSFASFAEIGEQRNGIVTRFPGAIPDLKKLSVMLVETYVRIPSEACRAVDPNHLNLGMRWAVADSPEQVAGWQNFDVFSLNNYSFDPTTLMDYVTACGVDLPLMVGEFHFGALDRGLTTTGLKGVATQADRGKALRQYIEKAAAHQHGVGVHYFQFCDQNIIGRFDGENYQIGMTDVAMQPYEEMIDACRQSALVLPEVMSGKLAPYEEPFDEIPMIAF